MPENAIDILLHDHEQVKPVLKKLRDAADAGRRQELLVEAAQLIEVHTRIEEEIFYPAFRSAVRRKADERLYFESLEEHHVVDLVLPELQETDVSSPQFAAKAKVLRELVTHHMDEEEKELFPRARKACSKEQLKELGAQLMERKEELMGAHEGGGRPASHRTGTIDLNTANRDDLKRIVGIDRIRAQRLIDHRKKHGPFRTWEELDEVPGFDNAMIRRIREAAKLGRGKK